MTADDYEAVYALYQQPGVLQYMSSFFPEDAPRAYFESYVKTMYAFYDFGMYVLLDARTGALLGHAGLGVEDVRDEDCQKEARVTLGYVISAAYRKKGLAVWACREILQYARDSLYVDRVWIRADRRNRASLAVAHRLQQIFGNFLSIQVEESCLQNRDKLDTMGVI